jgi:hypothetical protein
MGGCRGPERRRGKPATSSSETAAATPSKTSPNATAGGTPHRRGRSRRRRDCGAARAKHYGLLLGPWPRRRRCEASSSKCSNRSREGRSEGLLLLLLRSRETFSDTKRVRQRRRRIRRGGALFSAAAEPPRNQGRRCCSCCHVGRRSERQTTSAAGSRADCREAASTFPTGRGKGRGGLNSLWGLAEQGWPSACRRREKGGGGRRKCRCC